MNMLAKQMGEIYGLIDIVFYRNLVSLALLLLFLAGVRKIYLLKTGRPFAQLLRAMIGTGGFMLVVWSMLLLPLSTATALGFTAPLFVGLLSYPLLKEKVSPARIAIIFAGFSGILLIARPENEISLFALIIGLSTGLINGMVSICLRWLGPTEHTATTNFYFLAFGLLLTSVMMPFIGTPPQSGTAWLILSIGIIGLVSLLLKTQGYRLGPAALISPFSYTMIIWAIIYDYIFWGTLPTPSILAGSGIIIASNLLLVWREQRKSRQLRQKSPAAG
jgi:drug/metabolite transporter (DMT)-like permease